MSWWRTVDPTTRARIVRWGRVGGGALILGLLLERLGAGPFLDGVRRVDPPSVAAAVGITAVTTVLSAWRWQLIAAGLGLRVPLPAAVASYYRSQFLNSTLPGGVLGDVHRGVRHGEETDDIFRGLRSVGWDRAAGQLVQVAIATGTLLALASPVRPAAAAILGVVIAAVALVAVVLLAARHRRPSWSVRAAQIIRADIRGSLLTVRTGAAILLTSALVVAGHLAVFLVAARAAGAAVPLKVLVPLAMIVLLSMTIPTSIGGWGPREGVAAWAFAVAGLGASRGVETATVYGVLSLVATFPGAAVLVLDRRAPRASASASDDGVPVGSGVGVAR